VSAAALILAALLGTALASGRESPRAEETHATDPGSVAELVNGLLGSLMGGGDVTGEQLQREVGEVGGIPFRRDVPIAFLRHDELVRYLDELLESEYTVAQAEADQRLLEAFDLLPPGSDLRTLRGRLLQENIVGFYDERPGRQRLYAVSEEQAFTPMNQIVLAHELRHALQDQYEPLHWQLPEDVGDFDDRRLAWTCLLEGDATVVMESLVLARMSALGLGNVEALADSMGSAGYSDMALSGLTDVPGAPPVIRDHLVMPYIVGRDLARAIEAREGAAGMRSAWRRPPDSTEQVLHPEKFFTREAPRPVTVSRRPGGGRLLSQGVLGELLLRSLLDESGSSAAAAGWGGDAWRLWDLRGRTALAWASAWDDTAEAVEFEEALRGRFVRRRGRETRRDSWAVFEGPGAWRFALRREGDTVEMASSNDGEALDSLLR
jgi:hypothetical protein